MISHLNNKNKPTMVDISNKKITNRMAVAIGEIKFSKEQFKQIENLKVKKGEIDNVAIIAGINGAKNTSTLIPLCHNIQIENVNIEIETIKKSSKIKVISTVETKSKTGVEMEALVSTSIACLTIYDMCKSFGQNIIIENIKLLKKTGGKSNYITKKSKK